MSGLPDPAAVAGTPAGVVVVGRNEAPRLGACLRSALAATPCVVYADSGSEDGSADRARGLGVPVLELDARRPYTAARGRNEGFAFLIERFPDVRIVQFVDADCELATGWIAFAEQTLARRPDLAIACGRLRERDRNASIYKRLCDLEWDQPPGKILASGGIFAIRRGVFEQAGGFAADLVGCEERELCARIRRGGGVIERFPEPMACHDASMQRFAQWWAREVRVGYGELAFSLRFGDSLRRVAAVWFWTLGWLAALAGCATLAAGTPRALFLLIVTAILPVQAARIALRSLRSGRSSVVDALLYGAFTVLGKWPRLVGHVRLLRDRASGVQGRWIEYRGGAKGRDRAP